MTIVELSLDKLMKDQNSKYCLQTEQLQMWVIKDESNYSACGFERQ